MGIIGIPGIMPGIIGFIILPIIMGIGIICIAVFISISCSAGKKKAAPFVEKGKRCCPSRQSWNVSLKDFRPARRLRLDQSR